MIKAVFFDLDGTLVPCDTNDFVRGYFKLLAKYITSCDSSVDVTVMPKMIMMACEAVFKNDGSLTNKECFWKAFFEICPMDKDKAIGFMRACDHFYENEFEEAKYLLDTKDEGIDEVMAYIKEKMYLKVLATSPVFPRAATNKRINWIGYKFEDFDHVTTYDNCIYCKPTKEYYQSLLDMFALKADEVLMVGNDVREDIILTKAMGMKTFLIDRYVLNDDGNEYLRGNFKDLLAYLKSLE